MITATHKESQNFIAVRAKSFIGRPYSHMGRDENGMDCVGVVTESFLSSGYDVVDPWDYETTTSENVLEETLIQSFDCFALINRKHLGSLRTQWEGWQLQQGDVAEFKVRGGYHYGVLTLHGNMVHALRPTSGNVGVIHGHIIYSSTIEKVTFWRYRWRPLLSEE